VPWLILLLIALPILEIYVIVQVAHAIGGWWTLLLLAASAVLGVRLLRWRGARAWRELGAAVSDGRPPGRELLDGALSVIGAALLVPPGFVTTGLGLILLAPPTHVVTRKLLLIAAVRRWRLLGAGTVIWTATRTGDGKAGDEGAPYTRTGPLPGEGTGRNPAPGRGEIVEGQVVRERPQDPPDPDR
jgi:UPF0716 protein FxsA